MKRTREGKITSFFSPKSKLSTSDQPSASSITTFAQPSTSYLNTSDEPSISYFSTSDEGPSTSYVSTSDEGPSTSYVSTSDEGPSTSYVSTSTSDEGPSTSYVSTSDEGPSTSYVSTFDEGPSTSYVSTFDEGPSTSYFSTFDEGPSTSYFSTSDEGPSTSYVSTSHEPSISYFSTSHAPSTCTSYIATSSASCISPSHQPSNSHACRLNEQCTSRKSKEALSHSIDSSLVHPKNVRQADRLKHKTGYLSSWETEYTWVYYCEGEGMYCKLCHNFSTRNRQNQSVVWNKEPCVTIRKDMLSRHEGSVMHREALEQERACKMVRARGGIKEALDKQVTLQRQALIAAMKCLYWLCKQEIAHTTNYEPLLSLVKNLGCTHLSALNVGGNAHYTSERIIQELVITLAQQIEDSQLHALCTSPFYGLMIDESTDVSILNSLFCMARLHHSNQYLVSIHCAAHRLALACSQAGEDVDYVSKFKRSLSTLFWFFQAVLCEHQACRLYTRC